MSIVVCVQFYSLKFYTRPLTKTQFDKLNIFCTFYILWDDRYSNEKTNRFVPRKRFRLASITYCHSEAQLASIA